MKSVADKVAVVTGAASGIGLAVVRLLVAKGARVAVVDINEDAAETAARSLGALGTAIAVRTDIADRASVRAMGDVVRSQLGPPAILVNNAGLMLRTQPFMASRDEDLDRTIDVNLWGALHCARTLLPDLLAQPEASIVNVSSLGGLAGFIDQVPYSTCKFALRGFTESLRMELLATNVRVTGVYPGAVETNILGNSPYYTDREKELLREKMARVPKVSADVVASRIIGGILSGKGRILVGTDCHIMDKIVRLFPGAYSALLHRPIRKLLSVSSVDTPP